MKQIFALALALLLCFCLAPPAYAGAPQAAYAALLRQGRGKDAVESYHLSLQDAFDSITVNGAVVTLLRDITESADYAQDASATLCFGGHTLTGAGEAALSHTGRGSLTLGEPGGTGGVTGGRYALYISSTRDTLVQSGLYTADAGDGTAIYNAGGNLAIRCSGGEVTAQGAVALWDGSVRPLRVTGGCFIGSGEGFAVQKTRGSLSMTGSPVIQGLGGGLLLAAGPDGSDATPPQGSSLRMEEGALISAAAPGGTAFAARAEPLWDVALGGGGTLQGDIALALSAGQMTIEGPQIRVDGSILAAGGLSLQGGFYSEPPGRAMIGPGLFAVRDATGWYALGTEPPAPSPSPLETAGPATEEPTGTPAPTPDAPQATGGPGAGKEGPGGAGAEEGTAALAPAPDAFYGGIGIPKTGSAGWLGGGLLLAAAGVWGLFRWQKRK